MFTIRWQDKTSVVLIKPIFFCLWWNGNLSSKWMNKMHSLLPLNLQEERTREVLQELAIQHEVHKVFPVGNRSLVADFYLLQRNLVIECWMSRSRRGVALTWVETKAAYIDIKFKRLKENYPGIRCGGLVEVPQVDLESLREVIGTVMVHADFMAYTLIDFADFLANPASDSYERLSRMDG